MKGIIKQIKKFRITQDIYNIFSDNKLGFIQRGLTTVALSPINPSKTGKNDRYILSVEHSGNMGNSIKRSVDPNLKRIELPTIEELKSIYEVIEERGSPDYYYSIEFDFYIYKPKNN
jgi:hypothetical protein